MCWVLILLGEYNSFRYNLVPRQAYLVNGTTIESALGLQPTNNRSYLRNPASRNSALRFLYEDLQCIFIDEISMCGSDILARMK